LRHGDTSESCHLQLPRFCLPLFSSAACNPVVIAHGVPDCFEGAAVRTTSLGSHGPKTRAPKPVLLTLQMSIQRSLKAMLRLQMHRRFCHQRNRPGRPRVTMSVRALERRASVRRR